MHSITELLSTLRSEGIQLRVEHGQLRYRAPAGSLTPSRVAEIGRYKKEILELLQQKTVAELPRGPSLIPRGSTEPVPTIYENENLDFYKVTRDPVIQHGYTLRVLTGSLNHFALAQSIRALVDRHSLLRSRLFAHTSGYLHVKIETAAANVLQTIDISAAPHPGQRQKEVRQIIDTAVQERFDLRSGPLLRVLIIRTQPMEHLLLLVIHHCICDSWSLGVLIHDIAALYESFCKNEPPALAPLSLQFSDFLHWQQQWLASELGQYHVTSFDIQGVAPIVFPRSSGLIE